MMYIAVYYMNGEKIRKVADSWEALDLKVFGCAYSPSLDQVNFYTMKAES